MTIDISIKFGVATSFGCLCNFLISTEIKVEDEIPA